MEALRAKPSIKLRVEVLGHRGKPVTVRVGPQHMLGGPRPGLREFVERVVLQRGHDVVADLGQTLAPCARGGAYRAGSCPVVERAMARRECGGEALEIGGRTVEVTPDDHRPHVGAERLPLPLETRPGDQQGIHVDAPTREVARERSLQGWIAPARTDSDEPRSVSCDEPITSDRTCHWLQRSQPRSRLHRGRKQRREGPRDRLGNGRGRLVLELGRPGLITAGPAELSVQGTHPASR